MIPKIKLPRFTRTQWLTLIVFSIADFCNAICVSLQAPFYPKEAEAHGATPSEYGLVFGVFELVVFIISPIYGQHLNRIGPKFLFNGGIFTTGVCAILFGMLDKVNGHYPFIVLSFLIRIIEAMGNAAFLTASFAIIAKEFPDNVATTFASLETFFGLGLIVGPTVGGALYQVGGYMTPFAVLGSALFLSAIMTAFVLPDHGQHESEPSQGASLLQVLKIPGVLLAAASIIVTSMSIGFLSATLEPHLRAFHLTPVVLGLMFVINGGTYALTAPCWGMLCDRVIAPKMATVMGCLLIICAVHEHHRAHGFPNNLETYGLISGLWTSTFALGAFIGPTVGGILLDWVGFRKGSMFVVGLNAVVCVMVFIFLCLSRRRAQYKEVVNEEDLKQLSYTLSSDHGPTSNGYLAANGSSNGHANPCAIERPPGMNGIIATNSYKNRHGTWHRKEAGAVLIGPYSTSYGSLESRGFLSSVK
ncbi:hypothetical protein FOCC_FOCC014624 [Frankliniella occidentalis]|nr:hypothetical protein FOCC_FOCC014624 [Frankliniella occidentalis]